MSSNSPDGDRATGNSGQSTSKPTPKVPASVLEGFRPYLLALANSELDHELSAKGGPSDLVQQTMVEAHQALPRFEYRSQEELLAWLRQILLHNIADFRKRHGRNADAVPSRGREVRIDGESGRRLMEELGSNTPPPVDKVIFLEQQDALWKALAELPEEQRTATMLRFQEGLSWSAIGAKIGRSPEAARKLAFRAIERLKELLGSSR